jgi:thioredoxin 1
MVPEDEELNRINKKKLEEIMASLKKGSQSAQPVVDHPIVLTDSNFSTEITKHKVLVVDFWAPWCGPCRMVAPIIEQLAKEYTGKAVFGKLNVDENPTVSNAFRVQSIPTLLVFNDGRAVDGILGAVPKSMIESKLAPYISSSANRESTSFYG